MLQLVNASGVLFIFFLQYAVYFQKISYKKNLMM